MDIIPEAYKKIDLQDPASAKIALETLRTKKCLYDIYAEMYMTMINLRNTYLTEGDNVLEIGSGGGFMKDLYPELISSDIIRIRDLDVVFSAEYLPVASNCLDAIFAVHVIHHIPDITKFLKEALRVLKKGGGIICVEPYWSPVARFLYKKIHPEPFDETADSWQLDAHSNDFRNSNQALSYILLERDREKFAQMFPQFRVVYRKSFGFIRYLMTGGIWLKPKVPDYMFPLLKTAETILGPLMPWLAIHHIFVLKKY